MSGFDLSGYEDVAARRHRFFDAFPDGSIQVSRPVFIERPTGDVFVRITATVYRDRTDPYPGVDWTEEPVPGRTPYTKGSEVENASTSAIGRAILCVLAPLEGGSGASRQEVAARQDSDSPPPVDEVELDRRAGIAFDELGRLDADGKKAVKEWAKGKKLSRDALHNSAWLERVESWLDERNATGGGSDG